MRKKALQRILDAIEARLNVKSPDYNTNWVGMKMRPTQYGDYKNHPGSKPGWWKRSEGKPEEPPVGAHNIAVEKLKELANEPAPRT